MPNKPKVIVYDKWLETLGGGEVVACSIAEALTTDFQVELISKTKIPKKEITQKLGFELADVQLKQKRIEKSFTDPCQYFINSTFLDLSYNEKARNYLYVFFPNKIELNPIVDKIKALISAYLHKSIPLCEIKPQLPVEFINHRRSLVLGSDTQLSFTSLDNQIRYLLRFYIYISPVTKAAFEKLTFTINGKITEPEVTHYDHVNDVVRFDFHQLPHEGKLETKLHIEPSTSEYFLIDSFAVTSYLPQIILSLAKKRVTDHLRKGYFDGAYSRLKQFDKVFCDSKFAQHWIQHYWKLKAQVIYPPVNFIEVTKNEFVTKKPWICSVGRFFKLGHNKKQEIMIDCFKKLYDAGEKNWQLHLVGGADNSEETKAYLNFLEGMAQDYPIYLHINVSRKEVEAIYKKSKIYWHAGGFGTNQSKHPIELEHFGIAPIEAISAGCYPILFDGGGLPETIENLELPSTKHLFQSKAELVGQTLIAIKNHDTWYQTYIQLLQKLPKLYSNRVFQTQIRKAISEP